MTKRSSTDAARGIQDAERNLAEKREALEAAVAAGDVELVMDLRKFVEIQGPRALATAQAAKMDAEIADLEALIASGDLKRREDEASEAREVVRAAAKKATEALQKADREFGVAHPAYLEAMQARIHAPAELKALQIRRDQLIARSKADITAKLRAIAGMEPEPVEEPRDTSPRGTGSIAPRIGGAFEVVTA